MEENKKQNPWRFAFLAMAVYGFLKILPGIWANILMLWFAVRSKFSSNHAVSVGIIGGADGPTAIFLTTLGWVHYIFPVLMLLVGIIGYIKLKKQK